MTITLFIYRLQEFYVYLFCEIQVGVPLGEIWMHAIAAKSRFIFTKLVIYKTIALLKPIVTKGD